MLASSPHDLATLSLIHCENGELERRSKKLARVAGQSLPRGC